MGIYNTNSAITAIKHMGSEINAVYHMGVKVWPDAPLDEVVIGTQTWKIKNLDINDGQGGVYAYNNDENNVSIYGRMYTWSAAVRVAATVEGYHLPSDAEWTTLINYLGGTSVAGRKLREVGTTHWSKTDATVTNETGFTALPGGYRYENGVLGGIRDYGTWWSATQSSSTNAWRYIIQAIGPMARGSYAKGFAFSVRLIKN